MATDDIYTETKKAAVIFLDIEGYTQIVYQCGNDKDKMDKFCNLITDFWRKMEKYGLGSSIILINNAGDGFLALSYPENELDLNLIKYTLVMR